MAGCGLVVGFLLSLHMILDLVQLKQRFFNKYVVFTIIVLSKFSQYTLYYLLPWCEVDESPQKLIIITIIFSPALTSTPITIYPLTSFLWKDENGKKEQHFFHGWWHIQTRPRGTSNFQAAENVWAESLRFREPQLQLIFSTLRYRGPYYY